MVIFGAVLLLWMTGPAGTMTAPARAAASEAKASTAPAASSSRLGVLAPADAYFGPFGMSPLSIRSTIGLLGRRYRERTISDHDLLRKALITEDALRKWRTKYPGDPWLPPTFFHLEQLYATVQTQEARKHARAILSVITQNYPSTKEGHLSRLRLAQGFPALVPETALVETPAPQTAAPGGTAAPVEPSAAPSLLPAAAPSAVPTPS